MPSTDWHDPKTWLEGEKLKADEFNVESRNTTYVVRLPAKNIIVPLDYKEVFTYKEITYIKSKYHLY